MLAIAYSCSLGGVATLVGTPPNAIIFGSGRVKVSDMARAGIGINLIGAVVIALLFYFLGTVVFGIDLNTIPEWAGQT